MSLDVSPALLAQAAEGQVDHADFVGTVRASLPYAYRVVAGLKAELDAGDAEFATDNTTPDDEQRGQLLRALASNAIRGSLEEHFDVKLAFVNCHRVGAFRPGSEGGAAYREFTSLHNQIRNQSPELRSC
ncbi:SCO5389 family protein [Streptomyces rubellomurinus]|uniref:Uncharacterized protein n=2 Tax=Streptomyces TaxID=1883 RepID=A0A0F2TCQ0_STRR3|nr:SCO5389 family protein [Streptomyces rubellomurinus]KJS59502.1 hypothetical protein VM95_27015 [Streptomyces rubellomurinus]